MSRFVLCLTLATSLLVASTPPQAPEPRGALPYALAFDTRDFLWSTELAVTRDGRREAYDVKQAPPDSSLGERYLPNGTPTSVVGSKVHVTSQRDKRTVVVCPAGNCWRPAWSPDGTALAFYSDAQGPPQLWVYDVASGRARRLSDAAVKAKLWTGDEPRWSPDGATLFVPLAPDGEFRVPARPKAQTIRNAAGVTVMRSGGEAKEPGAEAPPNPRLDHYMRENLAAIGAIDVRSGKVRAVVPATATPQPSVLRVSSSGRWLSYLSVFKDHGATNQVSTMDLAVVAAAGGPVRTIAEGLPLLYDYHRVNYSWHPTNDALVFLKDKKLWFVDLSGGDASAPRQLGAQLGDLAPTLNWFTRDGRAVVVGVDPRDDKDYGDVRPRGIAVVPLNGSAPSRFSIDDARWVFRGIVKSDERTVWQPDVASITLVLQDRSNGERNVVRFDPSTGASRVLWQELGRLDNLTGGGSHEFVVGTYEDLRTPSDVYRFSGDFATKERVSHVDPRLDSVTVGTTEIFETTVPMHDGALGKVRTAVLLPAGAKRGDRLPAIVMMYPGGDVSREAESFGGGQTVTVPTLVFTSRGYAVILANMTLGPNREAGNPMQEMVDVLLPQVYRAAELGYVDVNRLAISGQSFGGYGTASIISRTNLFRAAIAVSGIYDLPGTYGHMDNTGGSFWIGWNEGGQARMGTHPWANVRRYLDNSPYYQADKIFTPLLIVHGDEDMAYHDGQKLFTALRRLDRPAQLASYAGQGHVIYEWKRASAIDAAQRMVAFYRKHLGEPPVRSAPIP
ncbi:MAG: S9 family peptidase [Gemmatimonadaceae bacterium]